MNKIVKSRIIHKSAQHLYEMWTTKQGLNTFFSIDNDIEIKLNGKYEIYFSQDETMNQRGSEGCKVIDYVPNKMLSFTWNVPPTLISLRQSNAQTMVVITFESNSGQTLINLTNSGYLDSTEWHEALQYFDKAWDYVLDNLVKVCL